MRDEIREKYGKWLGTPGDRSKVGEMTEKELLLGRTLNQLRSDVEADARASTDFFGRTGKRNLCAK